MTRLLEGLKMLAFSAYECSVHNVPMLVTQSGLQHVCPLLDCDEHVVAQGPRKEDKMKEKKDQKPLSKDERKQAIDDFLKNKKEKATADGVVTPDKPSRKVKIPKELNATGKKADKTTPAEGADKELDENVKPKKKKKEEKDPNMLSVSDIAKTLGIDPKRARAKLRAAGQKAADGRWPKVKRGSKEHQALVDLLSPNEEPDDVEDSDEDEENEDEE